MSDTPELGRLVVLHGAVLAELLDAAGVDRTEAGLRNVLKEIDALTMRVAHRSRSAIDYDDTKRGRAALEDAIQVVERLEESTDPDPAFVELVHWVWSKEQLENPPPGMQGISPERRIVTRQFVKGMKLLSPEFQPGTPALLPSTEVL